MLDSITVSEVMKTPVVTISPDKPLRDAATRLADNGIGSLVVCEESDPVGIFTDSDITSLVATDTALDNSLVREHMSTPVVTIDCGDSMSKAGRKIREHAVKRLPVVEDEVLAGIVTTTDLSNYVPHLSSLGRDQHLPADPPQLDVRADTAYENEEWEYEYFGNEGQIEVGDELSFSKTLTDEDVRAFAEASGDTNRLHLEDEFAEQSRFGQRIAHGTLVAGVISAALARLPGLTIYLSQNLRFCGPVSVGEQVTADCAVVEQLGENRFRLTTKIHNADGEPVIDGEATVISDGLPDS